MVAANLRMAACAPNFVIHEFFSVDPPYYQEILKERFPALREECLAPPEKDRDWTSTSRLSQSAL